MAEAPNLVSKFVVNFYMSPVLFAVMATQAESYSNGYRAETRPRNKTTRLTRNPANQRGGGRDFR